MATGLLNNPTEVKIMTDKKTYFKPLLKNLGLLREFIMDTTIPVEF
jgi:hypothetical protein